MQCYFFSKQSEKSNLLGFLIQEWRKRTVKLFDLNIFIILLFNLIQIVSFGQENKKTVFQVSIGYGQFAPHKKSLAYLIDGKATSLSFLFENRNVDSIHFGLEGSILNSGNPAIIGMIYGLNGFTTFPLGHNKKGVRLKIGVGLGYVENIFDANTNNQNIAIGSHVNTKIIFSIEKEIKLTENHLLNFGLGINHYSNGAFKSPNLGLNFLMANIGYSFLKLNKNNLDAKPKPNNKTYKKWQYSIILTGGIRENMAPLRDKYVILNINNRVNYIRNKRHSFAGGFDVTYNPGIQITADTSRVISPFQNGIFIGNERSYGPLTFAVDMGVYAFNQNLKSLFYHRFGIHFKVNKKMKLLFQLKSHWAVAEAFEFGIRYRIK